MTAGGNHPSGRDNQHLSAVRRKMLEHGPIQLLKIEELRKLQKCAVLERVEAGKR